MCPSDAIAVPSTTSITMTPTIDATLLVAATLTARAPPRLLDPPQNGVSPANIVQANDWSSPVADEDGLDLVITGQGRRQHLLHDADRVLHERVHRQVAVVRGLRFACSSIP